MQLTWTAARQLRWKAALAAEAAPGQPCEFPLERAQISSTWKSEQGKQQEEHTGIKFLARFSV